MLAECDNTRPYISSSPNSESQRKGDNHSWGVWANKQDIETYNTIVGRFTSEYGMQGMPSMNSIKKFTLPEDWSLESPVMLLHERHPS